MEVIKYQTSHKESSVSQGRKNNSSVWEESGLQKAVTSGYICSSKITWLIIDTKLYNMKKLTHTFHNRKRSIFCLEMSCWECWSTVLDKLTSENSSHLALFFLTRLLECCIYYRFNKKEEKIPRVRFLFRETSWICSQNSYSQPFASAEQSCCAYECYVANTLWKISFKGRTWILLYSSFQTSKSLKFPCSFLHCMVCQ